MFKFIFSAIQSSIQKIGKGETLVVVIFSLLIIGILNYKTIILDGIEIYEKIQLEKHDKEMRVRDALLNELDILLREYRAECGADRVLYFEYHNSKENLVGIPFKYVDLVIAEKAYGVKSISSYRYKDINAGLITDLYRDLVEEGILVNSSRGDFLERYASVGDFLGEEDESKQQLYVTIPGIDNPIGFMVLEWTKDDPERDWSKLIGISRKFMPRINATIVNKSFKK